MQRFLVLGIVLSIVLISTSCRKNRLKVDLTNSNKSIEIIDFHKDVFAMDTASPGQALAKLSEANPDFFNLFTYKIIRVGGLKDSTLIGHFKMFLKDTMIQHVNRLTNEKFGDKREISEKLNQAFKYYQYWFPEKPLPKVYYYISGFNQSVVTAENTIGIGLDKYLGRDCKYYPMLNNIPNYKIQNMHPGKIVPDAVYAWGMTEFGDSQEATTLLSNMIHNGKLMYFMDAMMPEVHDSLKIGYSKKQLDWCKKNEAEMWGYLVEHKLIFSNQRMDIVRYINDGPTTSSFPLDSPARTGIWLGWQIVRKYMAKHPEVTVPELMKMTDYQNILNESGYFPE